MSRTIKKPYTGSKKFDKTCRNNESYPYCRNNRTYKNKSKDQAANFEIKKAIEEDDFYFGSWYENMIKEEILEDYWENEWELDRINKELLRNIA